MRTSQYLLSTLKEIPTNVKTDSHQLMLRAGIIRRLASGLYTWLPTGLRVLKKIENIIREEMNNAGAIEIAMPIVQPAHLWKKSGRWKKYGPELLRFTNRSKHSFVLGPTHEEVITNLIFNELNSYKQLPINLFQIQTKFRDELRPRFGVIRSCEFLMKDAYSFHTSQESLQKTYDKMHEAYNKIFARIGLNFRLVQADTSSIGGNSSHEFQVLVQNGEDNIVLSDSSNYASNIECAEALAPSLIHTEVKEKMKLVDTPNTKTVDELVNRFNLPIEKTLKIFLVKATNGNHCPLIALFLRGDHELNELKVEKLPQVVKPLTFATEEEIRSIINVSPSYLGPVNIPIPLIIDRTAAVMSNFVAGANIDGKYYFGINWDRDVTTSITVADIRNVVAGDPSPDGNGVLIIRRGIEVGHIFKLGTEYSQSMNIFIQNKDGRNQILIMGCYGIGITRTVAAVVEQHHDKHGIIWPNNIAPFQVAILPINTQQASHVQELAEKLYIELCEIGIDTLIDDRKERLGVMLADVELIGIPHIVIIGSHNISNGTIEYKYRRNSDKQKIKISEIFNFLIKKLRFKS